jgi:hypothetical protein
MVVAGTPDVNGLALDRQLHGRESLLPLVLLVNRRRCWIADIAVEVDRGLPNVAASVLLLQLKRDLPHSR